MMGDKSCECQKINAHDVLKKSTVVKGAAVLVVLFGAVLFVNDLVLYHYLSDLKALEKPNSTSHVEDDLTTPG